MKFKTWLYKPIVGSKIKISLEQRGPKQQVEHKPSAMLDPSMCWAGVSLHRHVRVSSSDYVLDMSGLQAV